MPSEKTPPRKAALLDEFIEGLIVLPDVIVKNAQRIAKANEDQDEWQLIDGFSIPLKETMTQTANLIKQAQSSATASELDAADTMLRTMGSSALVQQSQKMALNIGSFVGKLGMAQIVQLIKKLIDWVLDLLGWRPPWLKKLIDLIDEILNALLGGGNARYTHALSVREQDYLNELTALANYEAASARLRDAVDSDEEL